MFTYLGTKLDGALDYDWTLRYWGRWRTIAIHVVDLVGAASTIFVESTGCNRGGICHKAILEIMALKRVQQVHKHLEQSGLAAALVRLSFPFLDGLNFPKEAVAVYNDGVIDRSYSERSGARYNKIGMERFCPNICLLNSRLFVTSRVVSLVENHIAKQYFSRNFKGELYGRNIPVATPGVRVTVDSL